MNGKKPSWLLRAGSFLLAALMVFGNLILPGGIFAASAESTSTLFSTDFEDYVTGVSPYIKDTKWFVTSGGTAVDKTVSVDQVMVEDVNGNKVLAVTSEKDVADIVAGYAFASSHHDDVTLSYNVAFATKGDLWLPTLAHYANTDFVARVGLNGTDNWFMTSPGVDKADGSGKDYYVRNSSGGGFSADALKWYTIKLCYTRDEAGTHAVETYIDGTLTNVQVATSAAVGVKTISMQALKNDGCKMYIDNIKVTEGDHTPAEVPTTLYSVNTVFYSDNFDDVALTEGVGSVNSENWQGYTNYSVGLDPDPDAEGNQVMVFADASTKSGLTSIDFGAYKQAVLEYRVYPTDDTVYLPRLAAKNGGDYIFMLHYANGKLAWRQSVNSSDQVLLEASEFAPGCWHTIKQAVDTKASTFYIWVDGKFVGSGPLNHTNSITRIVAASYSSSGDLPTYYDDFAVKAFVPALDFTVSNSAINLAVDESATLKWAFKPVVNSLNEIVFSNSDDSVATFDEATGKITALKAGTTTITLDPVQEGLETKTVTVTVTGPVTVFTEDFQSYTTDAMATNDTWTVSGTDGTNNTVKVVELNGNKVLELNNVNGTNVLVSHGLSESYDSLTMTYHVANPTSASTTVFYPSFTNSGSHVACFGLNGVFVYERYDVPKEEGGYTNKWYAIKDEEGNAVTLTDLEWHEIKLVYTKSTTGTEADIELYVDGVKAIMDMRNIDKNVSVNGILMQMSKWTSTSATLYVDNICVTTDGSNPKVTLPEDLEADPLLFETDFEDYTTGNLTVGTSIYSGPTGWNVQNGDAAATGYGTDITVTVEEINGNKVLAVNKLSSTAKSADFTLKYKLASKLESGSAVLSYNVGYSTASMQGWFPYICDQGNTRRSAYMGNNNGSIVYNDGVNTANSGWQPIFAEATKAEALKWYTVQEVYTLADGDNPATVSVYVDGVLTETKVWKDPPADIGGFVVQLYKGSAAGTMYLDNFKLTSGSELHTDLTVPASLVAVEKDPEVYYSENFEDETIGKNVLEINPAFRSDWCGTDGANAAYYTVQKDPVADSTGMVLKIEETSDANINVANLISATEGKVGRAVLSYKVYPVDGAGNYPITFISSKESNVLTMLVMSGGTLQYQDTSSTNHTLATMTTNQWHDIKLVTDVTNNRWYLYVDGVFKANIAGFRHDSSAKPYIRGLKMDAWSKHNATGICYDDIVVSEYIPIKGFTVGATSLNMVAGTTRTLDVTVDAGTYGSAPNVTFTADDSGVVSVDMFGKVTALKDGTATITVSHPDLPSGSKTVTVTVEKKVVTDPTIYYEEDFEDVELTDGIGALPAGLNANNGGYRVSEFVDANGNTHKAVEVYVEEKSTNNLTAFVNMSNTPTTAVLEYDLYFDENVNTMYAMTLRGKELYSAAIKFVLQNDGVFRTNAGVQLAKLSKNEWHHIKLVGDVNTYKWYLWIDGEYIAVEDNSLYTVSGGKISGFSGLCMDTYHASGVFKGIWYDNLKIYEPITTTGMTITGEDDAVLTNGSAITLDASKAEEYTLKISYAPENASLKLANFSTSDASVADVDSFGVIYAKGAGTATITVTPVDPYLPAVELKVTVTGDYVPKPILEEDFQDATEGTGGPAAASGSPTAYATVFEKNNGNKLLQVNSNDSTAHGFATIPFLNKNGAQVKYSENVHLSYWLAASATSGVFYIPGLAANTGGFVGIFAMKNGVFEYTTDGNSWTAITYKDDGKTALFNADEWYLIEQVYTGGDNCTLTMKINGREVEMEHYNRGYVNCVTMQMTKWMGTMIGYVDNMTVTEVAHVPMEKPDGNFTVIPTALKFVDDAGNEISEITIKAQVPTVLNLSFVPMGASDRDVTITSSNKTAVDLDSFGQLIGYENGESVITATLNSNNSIKATITVKVVIEEVTSMTVTNVDLDTVQGEEDTYTLVVGDHGFATAVAAPETADYKTVVWTSSNPAVATVDSYGEILALSPGTTVIKAASQRDATVCDTFTVVVTKPGVMKTIQVSSVTELKNALADVATINAGTGMTGNIEIVLAGGNYYLTETLKLGVEHSGTNGYSVIIKAAENASPVLSGASVVSGTWTKVEGKGYYSIQVSKDFNSRQLYVNNVRAVRARSEGGLTDSKFIYDDSSINVGYVSSDIELASYKYPEDLELVFKEQWTQPRAGVSYIVDNGDGTVDIVMDQPGWSGVGAANASSVTNKGGTSVGNKGPVWYENALELLDASGEWYLDTHTSDEYNILYYMPRPWENMETVVVTMPTLDNSVDIDGADGALVEISGTFSDDKHSDVATQVMNIHFEGITFADTTWMRPSAGYGVSDAQNNHIRETGDKLAPGAVLVEAANSIWFTGCTFTRLGINGLQMINGVQNSLIIGNHFYDISGNAINIGEPETSVDNAYAQGLNVVKNNDILNNFIHNIGVDYGSSAAISVGFASDMDMNHNEIFDIPYSGWHIGYGWNNRFPNNNKYMLLEYNFVHDFMGDDIYDGGAFYILGNTSGESYNYIQHNYIRNQMNAHGALYPDQGTTWFKFIENVIDLSESPDWHSGAPKWSHTNMKTLHLHFINNFSTTDYKTYSNEINFNTDDIQYGQLNISPDASWDDPIAQNVIANAGLESAYDALRNGQVERFEMLVNGVKNTGSEVVLATGESLKIGYNAYAIREGELVTSGLNYAAYYETQNPEVAEVDENGNVTAKSAGITSVRVWVLSNGIVDVDEFMVVVDDCAESVYLEGIEDTITVSTAVSNWQLSALIRSKLGRVLTPDSLIFGIGNSAVATVTEDGLLTPVAEGTTSLTVSATYDGVTVSKVYKVIITKPAEVKLSNASDMFAEANKNEWIRGNSTNFEVVDGVSVTGKHSSFATFGGTKYDNELLSFKLKIDKTGITSDWPSIVIRAQGISGEASNGGTDGYVICMGSGGIEVYRFVNNVRYVIHGNQADNGSSVIRLPGAQSAISPDVSGFTYTNSVAEHDIQVGAIADGGNVRILLYIDDVNVVDYIDLASTGAISTPGYFGMIGRGQIFTLTKDTSIADDTDSGEEGGDDVVDTEGKAALIGDVAFDTFAEALAAAKTGDTIQLLEDAEIDSLALTNGVSVDLNGNDLTANYLVIFGTGTITDSAAGVGLLKCENVSLPENHPVMPVYDKAEGGYRLFKLKSRQLYLEQKENSFCYITKPMLNNTANDIFMSQSETNRLTVKIVMTWTNAGNEISQTFVLSVDKLKSIYSLNDQVIFLNVYGAGSYVNNLKTACYIVSDTGVEWMPEGLTYVGPVNQS